MTATATPAKLTTCDSCGQCYDEATAQAACETCVTHNGCAMLRCPHCGYEQPRTPPVLERLLGLFRPRRKPLSPAEAVAGACAGAVPLSELRSGESAIVEKFRQVGNIRKFLSLGILPGTHITVLRHSPVVVLRVGYSEFAFDRTLASTVDVHRITS